MHADTDLAHADALPADTPMAAPLPPRTRFTATTRGGTLTLQLDGVAAAHAAEAALLLDRPGLAAEVYPLLSQWPGRAALAGTGAPLGPVDAFLALAAAAVGETALAAGHADDALRLCDEWRMPPVADWLTGLRSRYGF